MPKGPGWAALIVWLVNNFQVLPSYAIPDIAKVFRAWLIATQAIQVPQNELIVQALFEWLSKIDVALSTRSYRRGETLPPEFKVPNFADTRAQLQMTAFTFAHLNPEAADRYLRTLAVQDLPYDSLQTIVKGLGSLPKAAPAAFVDMMLASLVEEDDPDDWYRREPLRPFTAYDNWFSPPFPTQGPFLDILEAAPAEGLRLIRPLLQQAMEWRRGRRRQANTALPEIVVPFASGPLTFVGGWDVYHWGRSGTPSSLITSALMALEAWAHRRIEAGVPFEEVLREVLGPSGSSTANLAVAIDLVLSHWTSARDTAWPFEQTLDTLKGLKAVGIQIAMDDFGTGYSSLGNLRKFPFDKLKIDRAFVRDIGSPEAQSIIKLIIGVARSLNMETTAEGVETLEQYRWLAELGCDHLQGYLFGRPTPVPEFAPPPQRLQA